MSDEYTPSTEQVREAYAHDPEGEYFDPVGYPSWQRELVRRFDRWLAARDREVAAEALERAATVEADWTTSAWRPEEAETVVKLRMGLRRRATDIREGRVS